MWGYSSRIDENDGIVLLGEKKKSIASTGLKPRRGRIKWITGVIRARSEDKPLPITPFTAYTKIKRKKKKCEKGGKRTKEGKIRVEKNDWSTPRRVKKVWQIQARLMKFEMSQNFIFLFKK